MTHQLHGDYGDNVELAGDDQWAVAARVEARRRAVTAIVATLATGIESGRRDRVVYDVACDMLGHVRREPETYAEVLTAALLMLAEERLNGKGSATPRDEGRTSEPSQKRK